MVLAPPKLFPYGSTPNFALPLKPVSPWADVGFISNVTTLTDLCLEPITCDVEPVDRYIGRNQSQAYLRRTNQLPEGYYRVRSGTYEQISEVFEFSPT